MSMSFHVNNHPSFFFCLNIFDFQNMTSFGNKRRFLATTASKPCFALYAIVVVGCLFSMFLVLMYSAELALVCYVYIYILHLLCDIRLKNVSSICDDHFRLQRRCFL